MNLKDKRARHAYAAVGAWGARGPELHKQVQGLPVQLRSMGLAQIVALLNKDNTTRPLALNLCAWLVEHPAKMLGRDGLTADARSVLEAWASLDNTATRALDAEALRYAEALKLFSGGLYG